MAGMDIFAMGWTDFAAGWTGSNSGTCDECGDSCCVRGRVRVGVKDFLSRFGSGWKAGRLRVCWMLGNPDVWADLRCISNFFGGIFFVTGMRFVFSLLACRLVQGFRVCVFDCRLCYEWQLLGPQLQLRDSSLAGRPRSPSRSWTSPTLF